MFKNALLLFLAAFGLALPLAAQDLAAQDPGAEVIGRIKGLVDKPFQCDFQLQADVDGNGGTGGGRITFASSRMFAFHLDLNVKEYDTSSVVKVDLVADGSFLYVNAMENGEPEEMMPIKISLNVVDKLLSSANSPLQIGSGGMSGGPMETLNALSSLYGMQQESSAGADTLRYVMTSREADIDGPSRIIMDFDKQTWFPKDIQAIGEDGQDIKLGFRNVKFPPTLGPEHFKFNPGEGVMVNDLTPMLEMALNQAEMGGWEEGEEEF